MIHKLAAGAMFLVCALFGAGILTAPSQFQLACVRHGSGAVCTLSSAGLVGSGWQRVQVTQLVDAREGSLPGVRGQGFLLLDREGRARLWEHHRTVPRREWVGRFREWYRGAEPTLSLLVDGRVEAVFSALLVMLVLPAFSVWVVASRRKAMRLT